MPFFVLYSLYEQSIRLSDDIFELAVEAVESPQRENFNRICKILERALQRTYRRKRLAGL